MMRNPTKREEELEKITEPWIRYNQDGAYIDPKAPEHVKKRTKKNVRFIENIK